MIEPGQIESAMREFNCTETQIKLVLMRLQQMQRVSPGSFERFWSAFPNKVGKPAALKAFQKVAREIDAILEGVERYIREKPSDRPWLNPSTFLNQRRWEDQPAPVQSVSSLYDMRKDGLALLLKDIERREDESRQGEIACEDVRRIPVQQLFGGQDTGDDHGLPGSAGNLF